MSKRRTPTRILASAYHEAGHIVAADKCGATLIRATIERVKDQYGLTRYYFPDDVDPHKRIITISAGPLAQERHNPDSVDDNAAESDFLDIEVIIADLDLPEEEGTRFKI